MMLLSSSVIAHATAASLLLLAPLVQGLGSGGDDTGRLMRRYPIDDREQTLKDGHNQLAKVKLWLRAQQEHVMLAPPETRHNIGLLKKWVMVAEKTLGDSVPNYYRYSLMRATGPQRVAADELYGPEWVADTPVDMKHRSPIWDKATRHTGQPPPNIRNQLVGISGINFPTALDSPGKKRLSGSETDQRSLSPVPTEFDLEHDERKAEQKRKAGYWV